MKFIYIFIFLHTVCVNLFSQQKGWTLDECMRYAVEHGYKKNKQIAQNSIHHQNYMEAIGKLLPSITASSNARFNFGRGVDDDNKYVDINSFNNGYEVYSSLTLFNGLANYSQIKMQKINKLMGKQQLAQVKDEIAYSTMEAFFNVLYFKQMVVLAEQQLEESTNNLKQVQRMEELGVKGFPDIAEMQAKQAADNYNLTKQKNILAIGVIQLKEKMNFPIDEDLIVAAYDEAYIITRINDSAYDIYQQALNYTPKALAANSALKSKQIAYKSAKGVLYPTISANGEYYSNFFRYMDGSTYTSFKNQLKDKRSYYVGFSVSIPIFAGFSKSATVKRAKAEAMIAKTEYDETLRTLYSEIEQATTDVNGQADEYYQAKKQVEAMQIAHDVNSRKYNEGLISAIELHTSANRLLQAKTEELNTKLKYQLKARLLNYYKGIPFISE